MPNDVMQSAALSSQRPPSHATVADAWTQLLGAAPRSPQEDFFAAGGDSIMAAALVARVCGMLGVEPDLGLFLAEPTPAGLARLLDGAQASPSPVAPMSESSAPGAAPAPPRCSYAQERFWFIDQATGSNVVSNVSWALLLNGRVDVAVLERALAALALRHDTLRTRFVLRDGQPVQIVSPDSGVAMKVSAVVDEADAARLAAREAEVPFDLSQGPMLRAHLLVIAPDRAVLQFIAHHIICDDWSKGVILSELGAIYAALVEGRELDLPAPALQYPAYSRRQRERLNEEVLAAELEHWRSRLAGAPPAVELPADRPRPSAPTMRGARSRTTIPSELADALRKLGRKEGATFFMTMLAALEAFLYRYTGQDDLVIGTAIDNRGRSEFERAIGLFTNVLALRADLSGTPTFRDLLTRARECTLDAATHQELPFDRLAAAAPERDPSRHPIFQVFYEFIVPAPLELSLPGVTSEPFEIPKRTSEFDLGLYLDEQHGGLDAVWEYSDDLFERETVQRMARHFLVLLAELAANPDRPVAELALLDADERHHAVVECNRTDSAIPPARIQDLFEDWARRTPEAPALTAGGETLTYRELNERANRTAHLLHDRGLTPGEPVGLSMDRRGELIAAMLGILKAGGAYLPLNPDHPAARLAAQLEQAGARILIGQAPLDSFSGQIVSPADAAALPSTDPVPVGGPDDPAYVLYTSGSTGVPKGVLVTHRNVVNYATHMIGAVGAEGLQFGSVSAVSTDLGNTAIFPALLGGGCLHLVPSEVATDSSAFAEYVREHPLDVLKITPSHLGSLLEATAERAILPRRWLIFGGEALSWQLAERVSLPGGPRVMNHYGPTEATVGCCTYEVAAGAPRPPAATVPIGRPIANARAYVLDSLREPVPVGVPGELFIGGAGIARGYVNAPEQTHERFIENPFGEGRVYRTGDLVRRLADGSLEFLGRADEQVKIRGYRVEPAEVQAILAGQPGVRQAAVLPAGEGEGRRLVAYVVPDAVELSTDALLAALAQQLPAYMVPSHIAVLEAMPLTPNGKLDRSALPSVDAPGSGPDRAQVDAEPLSEVQTELSAIWAELLEREVGIDDSFFDAGGHSLLAIRLIARIRSEMGAKLTLKALIDAPTIRELSERIEAKREAPAQAAAVEQPAAAPAAAASFPRVPRDRPLRCSFAQEQFWLVEQLTPGSAAYNFSWPMRLRGVLDVESLKRAAAEVVRRHEALRTRFAALDGQPLQVVEGSRSSVLEVVDLERHADPQAEAARLIDELTGTPLSLSKGPLIRMRLLRLGEQDHILQIVVHHIVFDGVSKVVLYRELGALYEAFAAGRESPLSDPEVQYADFAEWQRSLLDEQRVERELEHWRARLGGMPSALELPTDRPRPPVASLRGERHRVPIRRELRQRLENLARSQRTTFFTVMLAAFDVLLSRYSGQEDVVVGTPVDTRSRAELEEVVGPFINTVVLRSDLSGSPSFSELLPRVQERVLDAIEHQELPFERLVEAIAPERDLSRHPLFQVLLALNPPEKGLALPGLSVEDIDPPWSAARVDLFLVLDDLPTGLEAIWEFSSDLFDRDSVERMADHFLRLLDALVADPDRPIDQLPLLSERERETVLVDWNRTEAPFPERPFEQLFADQARATPDKVAVRFEGRSLTYAELDARANQLAHRLQACGARPGSAVGVCLERSEELPVALLGTMRSGAAYVPIDPAFPPARQKLMLDDAAVGVLVTAQSLLSTLPDLDATVICVDRDRAQLASEPTSAPAHAGGVSDLAYVIYTSGSTGRPKGVEIEHRALINFLWAMRDRPGFAAEDVLVAVTTLSFDIAGLELYLPLLEGGCVVVASAQAAGDPRELARLLESSRATVMQATPATWRMLLDGGWTGLPGLKALCGGETLPAALAERLLGCGVELWNMYGPTETTIWSTIQPISAGERPSIGRPIANTTLFVLDRHGQPTPIGVPGELHIGGAGVARGYRNRAELTAERFVTDPYSKTPSARMYRTGDLARWRADGTLEYLGRLDHQVKLRGFRIELGEVEAVLARHPSVAAAAAKIQIGAGKDPALIAYVVPTADGVDADVLRQSLAEHLPAYMVPSAIVPLEQLPTTPNGKLDRAALPAPELTSHGEYIAPRTQTEQIIASLWSEILGIEQVGIHDDFFGLGGQSLLAVRLMTRLESRLELRVPVRALFEAPTVAALAERVEAVRASAPAASGAALELGAAPAPAPALEEPPPLIPAPRVRASSFAQERFWFIDQVAPEAAAYNISWPVRLRGALDVVALERALNEIVRRHDVLRTHFVAQDGRPMQVVERSRTVTLEFLDLSAEAEREQQVNKLVHERTQTPLDIATGPVLTAALMRLDERDHVLQIVVHHIVADGWSKVVFFSELGALYGALTENRPASLPDLAVQYADFADWQRSWMQGERLERELEHWRAQLEGMPSALELPTDRLRPPTATVSGEWLPTRVEAEVVDSLEALGRKHGATFFTVMLAAFDVLLSRYSGQEDVVVGTPVDTRSRAELEEVVGPFVNTVVLRSDLSGSPSFSELLPRVQERVLDAIEHQELPFERLVEAIAHERDLSRHPIFQVMIMLNPPEPPLALGALECEEVQTEKAVSRVDLTLMLRRHEAGIDAVWEFSTALFERTSIERMAAQFTRLLDEIVADPDRRIDELSLLGDRERTTLLEEWNRTQAPPPDVRLEQLVEEQARRAPERVAVESEGRGLTYAELDAAANRLAHRLRALGAGPGELVAVCLSRSEQLLVALLGVLKAGAGYVPIDPEFPTDRQAFMLEDAGVRAVVTEESLLQGLPELGAALVCLDRDRDVIAQEPVVAPVHGAGADELAYVIYTSGSTGKPKGVEIEHRALVNFLISMRETPGLAADDVLVAVTTLSFDIAGLELYLPLIVGARVVIASAETAADPRALGALFERSGATVVQATPTTWRMLVDGGWEPHPGFKALCGGEALPPGLADQLLERGVELWNMYGPTETTIWSTVQLLQSKGQRPSIGRPIRNTTVYVLDRRGRPSPVGVPGELHIGGLGLARGYRNRSELTAERFVTDPFSENPGARMYRTGDLARWRADGTLEFLGRLDHQVKLRGFRIELGEIESTLEAHPGIAAAAATIHRGPGGEPALVAYFVGDGAPPDPVQLRGFLAGTLPSYMIPSAIVPLERLPTTPNGKIDRAALPAPDPAASGNGYVAPRTETEEIIAALWSEVLGVEKVGVHDDFFALGGHSLLAAQLVSRVCARFDADLSVKWVFEEPTIEGLARRLGSPQVNGGLPSAPPRIERRPPGEAGPLSFSQRQLWMIDQWDPGAPTYNVSLPAHVRGPLDVDALHAALEKLLARHEALRTVVAVEDDEPVPVLLREPELKLEEIDLSGRPEPDVIHTLTQLARRPFDFSHDPLLRASVIRVGEEEHIVMLETHHIAFDGWSEKVLFDELALLYRGQAPPESPLQFGDFAAWQRDLLTGETLDRELAFWRRHLASAPTLAQLPIDHPRPQRQRFSGATHELGLPGDVADAVRQLCRAENVTPYMVVLSSLATLLYRVTGQDDLLVGSPVANRTTVELERTIGFVSNTLVFRARTGGNPSFRELLARVREMALDVYAHQNVPFEKIVEAVAPEREPGVNPLFQVNLRVSTAQRATLQLPGLTITPMKVDSGLSRFDLALDLDVLEDRISGYFRYNRDIFEPETIARLAADFADVLRTALASPDSRLLSFELASPWNGSAPGAGGLRTFRARGRRDPVPPTS